MLAVLKVAVVCTHVKRRLVKAGHVDVPKKQHGWSGIWTVKLVAVD
jgi:hypothetical protein